VYSLARPAPGVTYFRLDEPNQDGAATWATLTAFLAAGFPVAFGFSVPTSLSADPHIPYRPQLDSVRGGQAAVAVGYQNHRFGRGQHALFIRTSWGSQWGDNGNGWLPMAFVRERLARDFWTLISEPWLDSDELCQPGMIDTESPKSRRR
jgi:C1A family cysteine protease